MAQPYVILTGLADGTISQEISTGSALWQTHPSRTATLKRRPLGPGAWSAHASRYQLLPLPVLPSSLPHGLAAVHPLELGRIDHSAALARLGAEAARDEVSGLGNDNIRTEESWPPDVPPHAGDRSTRYSQTSPQLRERSGERPAPNLGGKCRHTHNKQPRLPTGLGSVANWSRAIPSGPVGIRSEGSSEYPGA
jgi:hypothetical protein